MALQDKTRYDKELLQYSSELEQPNSACTVLKKQRKSTFDAIDYNKQELLNHTSDANLQNKPTAFPSMNLLRKFEFEN